MHAFCAFLRGNAFCGGNRTDVIQFHTQRRHSEDDKELIQHHKQRVSCDESGKTVLEIGDPSRNVIEMIFKPTTTDTTWYSINIKQVLKLNNSNETLERFEKFREEVKNRDYDHYHKHPRNIVDGNEQLMFYGTELTCCKQFGTSKLCKDLNCSICSIIKLGFYTSKKTTGIWLTRNCQEFINNANAEMNGKMAIIVCRVISGRVIDINDSYGGDYDSIEGVKSNYLFVKNSSAVLPCFVIILNLK